jgi:hypothetical protein
MGSVTTSAKIPATPMLSYFRKEFCGAQGAATKLAAKRLPEAERLLKDRRWLPDRFLESVALVEKKYANYQPFYPKGHAFGLKGTSGVKHGTRLDGTVDVAARLSEQESWTVKDAGSLSFRYLDRELVPTRAKPDAKNPLGVELRVDLLLANEVDRTPILCELKVRKDRDSLYALVQLLTQAAYMVTRSQRERLVLFGSRPEFVLKEAPTGKSAPVDLYVMLVESPKDEPWPEITDAAIAVGRAFVRDARVRPYIRRLRWLAGTDDGVGGLTFSAIG